MIKTERPPNFDQIVALFPGAAGHGVLFAYGEDIYNPSAVNISPHLLAHEHRHCARQFARSAESWWQQYLTDSEFRYGEELLAHAEEYRSLCATTRDRNQRAKLHMATSRRLVAPLYNYRPPRSLHQAMRDLEQLV